MTEPRRFARFGSPPAPGVAALPDDGMCLSVFLVVRAPDRPHDVLLGRIDPNGPWEQAAAIDGSRARRIGERWVLPASQLLLFEPVEAAARRISSEMLGRSDLVLGPPQLFSEAYRREGAAVDPHWDLQFVYVADWPGGAPERYRGRLWKELAFVDVRTVPSAGFGRGHGDVLALVGLPPRPT